MNQAPNRGLSREANCTDYRDQTPHNSYELFGVGRTTIYYWLKDHRPARKPGRKGADKIDMDRLLKDARAHPDKRLRERAELFDVSVSGISVAGKRLGIKKTLKYAERQAQPRIEYLTSGRERVKTYGSDSIVYLDESGFSDGSIRESMGSVLKGNKFIVIVRANVELAPAYC